MNNPITGAPGTHDPLTLACKIATFVKACTSVKAMSLPQNALPTPMQYRNVDEFSQHASMLPLDWLDRVAASIRGGENVSHRVTALAPVVFGQIAAGRLPDGWVISEDVHADWKRSGRGKPERVVGPRIFLDLLQLDGTVLASMFVPFGGIVDALAEKIALAMTTAQTQAGNQRALTMYIAPNLHIDVKGYLADVYAWCDVLGFID